MGSEQLEKVKDKIEKLLRLANNNPNVEEAAAAAKQAQRLMTKYSIEQATVRLDEEDGDSADRSFEVVGKVTVASGKRLSSWRTVLATVIARHNRCRVLIVKCGGFSEMQFVGMHSDTTLCVSLYVILMPMVDRMAKHYVKERRAGRGKAKTIGNSYRFGVVHAINEKMGEGAKEGQESAVRANPKATQALAKLEDVQAKIDEYLGVVTTTKVRSTSMDASAWHRGHADGRNIDLGEQPRPLHKQTQKE